MEERTLEHCMESLALNQDRDLMTLKNILLIHFIFYLKLAMDPAIKAAFEKMKEKFTL